MKINGCHIRQVIQQENVINLDLSYLSPKIELWWCLNKDNSLTHLSKLSLISLILSNIKPDDAFYFDKVGMNGVSGVCATGIFDNDDFRLAHVAHEALSEIFFLKDIEYSYEDHKALFLKPGAEKYRDWGNGYGEITPHSDDLYEDLPTDILALTVCRDLTNTPTRCYMMKDVFKYLLDSDIETLMISHAIFKSGKNVTGHKQRERPLLEYSAELGVQVNLDFRIDTDRGERMVPIGIECEQVIKKLRDTILDCEPVFSVSKTGTFFAVANNKVLHARSVMNLDKSTVELISKTSSFSNTPRLLYRSKGPRHCISLNKGYSSFI